ncbi:sugar phosphate isomerase/epimerase family protein [Pelagibacterium lentulum]|uniref:Xylose isomerase n=1 Tax=Pelagibacterium lentulum TaxID=2029865 RepID=A0A916W2Q0_9HYPH|nr:sugar phosphate isomerase/epimerase [Pelagibacterium lentulum]GGA61967.1 xylose isomerase [Pelagibacterium lentulum]
MTRALGLGHFTFLDLPPAELVRLARRAGFEFVGMRFHPVAPGALNWLPDAAGLRELARVMDGEGIGLYDIETVVIDETLDPETLVPAMDAASALGGKRVNVCADVFPALTETFARISELAAARGLGLDLECMAWRGVNTPRACLDLIASSGASNAAYLVDALHHSRCGGVASDIAAMSFGKVVSAQLCDAPATAPSGNDALLAEARGARLLPGKGGLDLAGIVRALPAETVISVELPSASDTRPPLERARAIFLATSALFAPESA